MFGGPFEDHGEKNLNLLQVIAFNILLTLGLFVCCRYFGMVWLSAGVVACMSGGIMTLVVVFAIGWRSPESRLG